jgi:hypothetical protein
MITTLALFSFPQVLADRAGMVFLFIRDSLMGALVVFTAAGLCGLI